MADYGAQDTSTTSLGANQFPISEAWTPNAGFSAVEGGTQTTDAGGKKSAPVRIEVKDGSDVAQGLTTDAAVTGDNAGTLSAKLRGLSKIFADMWDSTNHWLQVKVMNGNANGQSTMANSAPVVIASDQTAIPVKRSTAALFSTTQTAQPSGNSGDLTVSPYTAVSIDVNITANPAGSSPTIQFFWERKGISDGIYYPLWQSDLIQGLPANPTAISTSIGAGMEWPQFLGTTGRLRWVVGGTATPTYTFTPNVQGS